MLLKVKGDAESTERMRTKGKVQIAQINTVTLQRVV